MSKSFLESIKVLDGVVYHLAYHQARLERSLESIGVSTFHHLASLISPPQNGLYRCRVIYNAKSIAIEYLPYKKREIYHLKIVSSHNIAYPFKYEIRSSLERLFTQRGEADDILIVKNGYVTDTSIANIAFYNGEIWLTPKRPLLYGVTRERLLNEAKIVEEDIRVEDIKKFKKIALMNAMIDFDIIAEENIGEIIC